MGLGYKYFHLIWITNLSSFCLVSCHSFLHSPLQKFAFVLHFHSASLKPPSSALFCKCPWVLQNLLLVRPSCKHPTLFWEKGEQPTAGANQQHNRQQPQRVCLKPSFSVLYLVLIWGTADQYNMAVSALQIWWNWKWGTLFLETLGCLFFCLFLSIKVLIS